MNELILNGMRPFSDWMLRSPKDGWNRDKDGHWWWWCFDGACKHSTPEEAGDWQPFWIVQQYWGPLRKVGP